MIETPEDTWPTAATRAANRAQALRLTAQVAEGGLRFEVYLPLGLVDRCSI